jgi:hypothetical protein
MGETLAQTAANFNPAYDLVAKNHEKSGGS